MKNHLKLFLLLNVFTFPGAMAVAAGERPPNIIVFLTDGLPTVGEDNVADILKNVNARNQAGTRIFSFGVGYDVMNTRVRPEGG